MADNVAFQSSTLATPAAGETIAADDVGGVKYQYVKLDLGGNGVSSPVSTTVPVSDGGGSLTVDGTVAATQSGTWNVGTVTSITNTVNVADGGGSLTVDGTVSISGAVDTELPTAAALADATANPTTPSVGALNLLYNGTTWDRVRGDTTNGIDVDVTRVSGNVTVVDGGGSLTVDGTVTANAGTGTFTTKETRASTAATTSVAGSATSVTLLASNASRLAASIYNDSTAVLYVKLGATASTSSFAAKLQPDGYYEVPGNYTGVIDGIWASAAGNARITELT